MLSGVPSHGPRILSLHLLPALVETGARTNSGAKKQREEGINEALNIMAIYPKTRHTLAAVHNQEIDIRIQYVLSTPHGAGHP